jgi:hypothetical protein
MKKQVSLPAIVLLLLSGAGAASAQVLLQPQAPPSQTAAQESWFVSGDPVVFGGLVYHRAGAEVFFNGDVMVRAGTYGGIPIYVDTTLEPNSIVFVPVSGRLLQPYERLREGDAAGTTGSRTPSFPVTPAPGATLDLDAGMIMAQGPPVGREAAFAAVVVDDEQAGAAAVPEPVGTTGVTRSAAAGRRQVPVAPAVWRSARAPQATLGVWVEYDGQRWEACGDAEPFDAGRFARVGTYRGFPVYSRQGLPPGERIYLPSRTGFATPYWRGPLSRSRSGACEPPGAKAASVG